MGRDERDQTEDMSARRFQVLSLDGGGARGVFTAAVLAGLEDDLGRPVLDHFDLVAGTSTGGLIALALGAGLSPREIVEFYLRDITTVFPGPRWFRTLRRLLVAKYNARGLEAATRGVLGDILLGESCVPLVVPAYSLAENDVYIFKTPHHPRLRRDWRVPMWEVAMATSAAPTYFPAYRLSGGGGRLVDGGVWANNPAMVGVTEAVSIFGRRLSDVRVFSLGTTSRTRARPRRLDNAGLARWALGPNIVDVLLAGQSVGTFAQVQHLVGKESAHRLDPPLMDGDIGLDGTDADALISKAAHHSRHFCPTFEEAFGGHLRKPYTPLYGPKAEVFVS